MLQGGNFICALGQRRGAVALVVMEVVGEELDGMMDRK